MRSLTGGAGGDAASGRANSSWIARIARAEELGNYGGTGRKTLSGKTAGTANAKSNGENGTGGLLMLYADNLHNLGEITAEGSKRWI